MKRTSWIYELFSPIKRESDKPAHPLTSHLALYCWLTNSTVLPQYMWNWLWTLPNTQLDNSIFKIQHCDGLTVGYIHKLPYCTMKYIYQRSLKFFCIWTHVWGKVEVGISEKCRLRSACTSAHSYHNLLKFTISSYNIVSEICDQTAYTQTDLLLHFSHYPTYPTCTFSNWHALLFIIVHVLQLLRHTLKIRYLRGHDNVSSYFEYARHQCRWKRLH